MFPLVENVYAQINVCVSGSDHVGVLFVVLFVTKLGFWTYVC